jgi:hypothetical protein
MLKLKSFKLFFFISLLIIISIVISSCATPRSGKYVNHRHKGSSSYYNKSSYNRKKAKGNTIPIAKNYKIKNRRTSGNY